MALFTNFVLLHCNLKSKRIDFLPKVRHLDANEIVNHLYEQFGSHVSRCRINGSVRVLCKLRTK